MRKSYLILFIAIALFLYGVNLSGQGVSINEEGSSADNSAILDIKSTDIGLRGEVIGFFEANCLILLYMQVYIIRFVFSRIK